LQRRVSTVSCGVLGDTYATSTCPCPHRQPQPLAVVYLCRYPWFSWQSYARVCEWICAQRGGGYGHSRTNTMQLSSAPGNARDPYIRFFQQAYCVYKHKM
jgi:hypothetical protein